MAHISVVVPVYKAQHCLEELYSRLATALESITSDFEIVLVEDCGGDESWPIILRLREKDRRVKGIQFSRNFGQHHGITAGLDHCDGDWVIVMDCDLQDRPEEIPRLYAKAQEGYEVVLARRGRRRDSLAKRITSWLFYRVFRYLADVKYDSEVGNFRIISRKVVSNFRQMREQLRFFGGMVNWMSFPTASVDVTHAERHDGRSTYTYRKLWKLAIDIIIAYSDKPLLLSVQFGFTLSFLAFLYGLYIVYRVLAHGAAIAGWSSVIVSIYFIGGFIIGVLGILGIYLGKTFEETKKRPLYIIMHSHLE